VRATSFADSVAKALDIDLVIVGAATHEDKQLADVQSLISRNVDALVVVPVSIASSPGLLRVINNAHVPVVVADRYPGFPAKNSNVPYLAFVGPNNITAGVDIANFLVVHGVKKVVALGCPPGDSNAEERKKGLEKAIADAKGVELVQYVAAGETEDSRACARSLLVSMRPE
jgi:ABC-type sugar transport system substrate-binding protein